MTRLRVYQVASEVLNYAADPSLRVYQVATEVASITGPSATLLLVYQVTAEAIRPNFRAPIPKNPKTFTAG